MLDSSVTVVWTTVLESAGRTPRRSQRVRVAGMKRPQPDVEDADLARMGDPRTQGTVGSLVGNGAYNKALKHLLSEGMMDLDDPAVIQQLQDLHP